MPYDRSTQIDNASGVEAYPKSVLSYLSLISLFKFALMRPQNMSIKRTHLNILTHNLNPNTIYIIFSISVYFYLHEEKDPTRPIKH